MDIQVLGPGCYNCLKLEAVAVQAVDRLRMDASIVKVTDVREIMRYGVMSTPALVVDGRVRVAGRVPSVDEVVAILQD